MSWKPVLKASGRPRSGGVSPVTKVRWFLLDVFGVPVDIPLNISSAFLQRVGTPAYDGVITESRFNILLELNDLKKYQELVDTMTKWYDEEGVKVRRKSSIRNNKQIADRRRDSQ